MHSRSKSLSPSAWGARKTMKTTSIRSHLLWLVFYVSILLVVALGCGIYVDFQQSIAHRKTSLRTLAAMMVSNTGGKIASTRQILERLAQRDLVRQVDANHCDPILQDLHTLDQAYANVAYVDLDGLVVCSALEQPGGKPMSAAQLPWYQQFRKSGRFSVGQPHYGPISKKWISVLSAPIRNERNEMVGSVHLSFDLKNYDPDIPAQFLPEGSRYGFFTEDGIMVWRNLDPEGVIGTRPNAEAARKIAAVQDGEVEDVAVDGVTRFFTVVRMPQAQWIAFVGVPASEVYAGARRRAVTATAIALIALTALILLALFITRKITGPIAGLQMATRSVFNGDLQTRVATEGPTEVVNVATAFNAMTDRIEASTRQLEAEIVERVRSEESLRQSERTFRKLFEDSSDAILLIDSSGVFVESNQAALDLLKTTREQFLLLPPERISPEFQPDGRRSDEAAQEMISLAYRKGLHRFDWTCINAEGGEFVVEVSLMPVSLKGQTMLHTTWRDITERKRMYTALQQSLKDKDALLKEVHHRVKNNLQVISSLLRLESRRSAQADTRMVLTDMQGRIRSMALLHESLYRSGTFASVDLASYLKQIVTQAFRAQSDHSGAVRPQFDLAAVEVGMDQAIACGLLVNELVSNSLKHGFPNGRSGEFRVALQPIDAEKQVGGWLWRLHVSDSGVGLPGDFDEKSKLSLGLQLVGDLSKQMSGSLVIDSQPEHGAAFTVLFEVQAPAALAMPE